MATQSYVERAPVPALADLVRVVWIQRIGAEPYVQRNLPTGGVELHCPVGSVPRVVGPLTGPSIDVLAPGTTLLGIRFWPGVAVPMLGLPASELVDLTVDLDELWGPAAFVLGELLATAEPEAALAMLQDQLVGRRAAAGEPDALVSEAVRRLMPWRVGEVGALREHLSISESQLRRRCRAAVGIGPKALQRTLRFQGFLALVQATPDTGAGLAGLAAEMGYADQAHLTRECVRLTGLSPRAFLGEIAGRCDCGHDHAASYAPLLRARPRAGALEPTGASGSRATSRRRVLVDAFA